MMSDTDFDEGTARSGWVAGLLFGALVGTLAGVAVGLLSAPRSGRATRRRLKHEVTLQADRLRDRGEDLLERGEEILVSGKEAVRRV